MKKIKDRAYSEQEASNEIMEAEKIFEPYAKAALFLKNQFIIIEGQYNSKKDLSNKLILKKQMGTFKSLINEIFRQTGDFVPTDASEKALKYCDDKSLGDIFMIGWNDQCKFEKIPNGTRRTKGRLMYEHKVPVAELIKMLMKAETLDDVLAIFLKQEIVWILKEEDIPLPNSNRPDSDREYKKAGIKVTRNRNTPAQFFLKKINKRRKK